MLSTHECSSQWRYYLLDWQLENQAKKEKNADEVRTQNIFPATYSEESLSKHKNIVFVTTKCAAGRGDTNFNRINSVLSLLNEYLLSCS